MKTTYKGGGWLRTGIKEILWRCLKGRDGLTGVRVISGPSRGTRIRVDFRSESSYWLGTYDRKILSLLMQIIKPGQIAYDCGAYIGIYTATMRRAVGLNGRVYAFEASSLNYQRIARLPEANGWRNLQVEYLAIGEAHTTIRFASNLGAASGPIDMPGKNFPLESVQIENVPCSGVDELIFERGFPAPDFLKFDLETGEGFALLNGSRLWKEKRPTVLVELHKNSEPTPFAFESAEQFLRDFDYYGTEVHLGCPVKSVDDFVGAEKLGVQCTILAVPKN
jgi:FkbM family methyltransferase